MNAKMNESSSSSPVNSTGIDTSGALQTSPSNSTGVDPSSTLQIVMDVLLISLTVLLMLSFGCSLQVNHIRSHFSRPLGVVTAIVLHFVLLPYVFYALICAMSLDIYDRLSLTVLATCPAGGISNLFVHYADGDLALGVIISASSTVLALGFMPLNMWMFSRSWGGGIVLPYVQVSVTMSTTLVPVAIGMIVVRYSEKVAKWIARVGSSVATVMIVATVIISSFMYPQMYTSTWKTWVFAAIFAPVAFTIAYLIALSMRMPADMRRTLGIATSTKSMALCLTIIALSFSSDEYLKYLVLPELHSILMMTELALFCLSYRLYRWCNGKYVMSTESDTVFTAEHDASQPVRQEQEISRNGSLRVSLENVNININRRMSNAMALSLPLPSSLSEYRSGDRVTV